ncbi:MAG: hypothetical protein AB1454_10890 [Candidatus Auribacterota bacterium]
MKLKKQILFLIISVLCGNMLYAEEITSLYKNANDAYKNKDYKKAIAIYESILAEMEKDNETK